MIKFNDRSVRKIVVVATVFLAAAIVLYGVGLFVLDESYRQFSRTTQQRQFVLGDEWHDADLKIIVSLKSAIVSTRKRMAACGWFCRNSLAGGTRFRWTVA